MDVTISFKIEDKKAEALGYKYAEMGYKTPADYFLYEAESHYEDLFRQYEIKPETESNKDDLINKLKPTEL